MSRFTFKKDDIYQLLKDAIVGGKYPPMTKLPNELEFCGQLGVAKVTLRSALARLEQEGRVTRVRGKGTFVLGEQKSSTILVCIPRKSGLEMPHNYICPGIDAAAGDYGFTTELCFNEYIRDMPGEKALSVLREKNLYGALLIYSNFQGDEKELEYFRELGIPVVIVHGVYEDRLTGCALLHLNLRLAWKTGLEYLSGKGHRNVKILTQAGATTVRGWEEEEIPVLFEKLGLESDARLVYSAGLDDASADNAAEQMMEDGELPTAVICFSDFLAIRFMEALKRRGLRVPEDIAVMGFCGYPGDEMLETSLSTVDFDYAGMGRSAVSLLAESGVWFSGSKSVQPPLVNLPFKIVERDSTKVTRHVPNFIA